MAVNARPREEEPLHVQPDADAFGERRLEVARVPGVVDEDHAPAPQLFPCVADNRADARARLDKPLVCEPAQRRLGDDLADFQGRGKLAV